MPLINLAAQERPHCHHLLPSVDRSVLQPVLFLCYGNINKQIGVSHIKHGLSYDQLIVLLLLSLEF